MVIKTYLSGFKPLEEEKSIPSRQNAILDLMKQGVIDPPTILNYLNYDEQGNKVGDFTAEEVKALQPKANKISDDVIFKAEELTGLRLKDRNITYSSIEMGKQAKGIPLGQQNKNTIVINTSDIDTPAGETSESTLIHELIHTIISQNNPDISYDEREAMAKDAEYYYLAGGKGTAPSFKKLEIPESTAYEEKKPVFKPLEKIEGEQMFTPTIYESGFKPLELEYVSGFKPLEILTQSEREVRKFQEQWRKEHPIKMKYGMNDYTPLSYLTLLKESWQNLTKYWKSGFKQAEIEYAGFDISMYKPVPYKSIEVENEEFKGIANKLLRDYIQRGNFAAANVADALFKGDNDLFDAAWRGLSGKEQRYFSDVLKGVGMDNTSAGIYGFVMDVGLDPINYVPLGLGIKAVKKGISKAKLTKEMAECGLVKNMQKLFTPGQGMPKELYKFIKYRGRDLDAKQMRVLKKIEKLFKNTTKESREMMSRIRVGQVDINKLNPKQAKVYDSIVNKLRTLGKEAVDMKLISKEAYARNIDDYIHGFYMGRTKLGGQIWGRAGKAAFRKPKVWDNPVQQYDWATNLKSSMEKINNLDDARKLAVKSGFVEDASTLSLRQIKGGVKNIKVAEMDFLKSSALREIEQIREVGRISMVNEAMRMFGKPLPKGLKALPDDLAVYITRGTVPDLFLKQTDEVSKGIKALLKNIKSDLVEITPDVAQALAKRRGVPKAYMIPKEIAHHLNLIGDYLVPGGEEFNIIIKNFDRLQGVWKGMVTALRLPFHMRNATSNVFLGWLSGINAIDLFPRHVGAIKMMRKARGIVGTNNFGKVSYSKIEDLCQQVGAAGRGWMGAAEPRKVWNTLQGIFENKVSTRIIARKLNPIELGRRFGTVIEDASRRAVFLDEIVKSNKKNIGEAAIDAAERVGKFLYDYDELSLFEKKYMKRIIPFYTWMRKNIPNMFNQLLEQPGKFSKIGKIRRISGVKETAEEKALKPDWMAEMGYAKSPYKVKGKPLYYYVDLPTKDLDTLFSIRDMYSSLTPFKEIPHMLLNVKSFPELGARIAEEGKEYTYAPAWMTFLPEKVKKFLKVGPGIDYQTGEKALMIHKKVLYALETFLPPTRDLNMLYPQPIEVLEERSLYRLYSQPTGMQWRALDLDWETQNIVREMEDISKKLNALGRQRTDWQDTNDYADLMRRYNELEDKIDKSQKR